MNAKENVVIFGNGNWAQLAHFHLTHDSPYEVAAFTADAEFVGTTEYQGLPLVPFEEILDHYPPDQCKMFVALGYRRLNEVRAKKCQEVKGKGYGLISYVSSRSKKWGDLNVGENCFIFPDVTISPFATVGNNVIVAEYTLVAHHSSVGDHCFIASHSVVSGSVTIEPYCFLGAGATLGDGIRLARRTVVGAGTTVVKDTVEDGVYICPPARLSPTKSTQLPYFTGEYEDRNIA